MTTETQDAVIEQVGQTEPTQETVVETETVVVAASSSAKRPADDAQGEDKGESSAKRKKAADGGAVAVAKIQTTLNFARKASTSKAVAPSSSPGPELPASNREAIADLEKRTMGKDWQEVLQGEFKKEYFIKLKNFIQSEYKTRTIYPVAKDVYSWSRLTKLGNVRVVVIGQDPYHGPNQAHGLSFSVRDPVPPPPSLVNIYKQLVQDIPGFKTPSSGDLTATARQGVLWLNTSLTVRNGQAASHSKMGWETFTAAVLKAVVNRKGSKGVVFLAWGAHAQKVCQTIGIDTKKHLVLKSAHPSPLSAHRGFLGNEHFKKANDWLISQYGKVGAIDWTVLNPPVPTKEGEGEEE